MEYALSGLSPDSKAGNGKSCLVRLLYSKIARFRPVIIFDYRGEHKLSRYPNFSSRSDIVGMPDMFSVKDFGFMISDFDKAGDWISMGFPDVASSELAVLATKVEVHNNDPELFVELLSKLPVTEREIDYFNESYPQMQMQRRLHEQTQMSMVTRFNFVRDYFITPEQARTGEMLYIPDWGDFLAMQRVVHVDMNMTELDVTKARAYVGKILEQIAPKISLIKPLIILEEADKLAPNIMTGEQSPSSLKWILEYSIKLQKFGVELMAICQDLSLLNATLVGNAHQLIFGQLPAGYNPHADLTEKLKWDIDKNYREFVYIRTGKFWREVFVPDDTPCMF